MDWPLPLLLTVRKDEHIKYSPKVLKIMFLDKKGSERDQKENENVVIGKKNSKFFVEKKVTVSPPPPLSRHFLSKKAQNGIFCQKKS